MKACYINLDSAAGRRARLEAGFAGVPQAGWTLSRFPAVTAAEMAVAPGRLSPAEKACFESHRRLLGENLADETPLFVLEDDAAFSQLVFPYLGAALAAEGDWDLLFTDIAFIGPTSLFTVARKGLALARRGACEVIPLQGRFASSTAYLVRGSSKAKLHALLSRADPLDEPYDLYLGGLCAAGALKVAVCLPFLTTISQAAGQSQIREDASLQVQASDEFRRLMFIDCDLEARRRGIETVYAQLPEAERLAGALVAAISLSA